METETPIYNAVAADRDKFTAALIIAADPTQTDWHRSYQSGFVLGSLAPVLDVVALNDIVTDAHNNMDAVPYEYLQVLERARMWAGKANRLSTDTFLRSGILAGYKAATEDRDDAQECTLCERRILTDIETDVSQCERHGWMHDDCRTSVCRDGLYPQGCYER